VHCKAFIGNSSLSQLLSSQGVFYSLRRDVMFYDEKML
jgi:hypothetical protein